MSHGGMADLLFEQSVCQICKFISLQKISTDELVQRDVLF